MQAGQSLWTIAAIYQIELPELLRLNRLGANAYIFPGDQLIIQPPQSQPTTEANDDQPTAAPKTISGAPATPTPLAWARVQTPTVARSSGDQPLTAATQQSRLPELSVNGPLLWVIGGLVVGGTLLLLVGSLLNRRA